ncbi:spindle assembly abnormal protein 6 homolog isoform X2 [Eriocheir sinensis]|uniref:spindle assembly abnormal protein 6 homolog isoform X2 n=1 Tax=Eriocheir sinensis TaxID=95602 RepID=UPI0021C6502E|nr:spindle assembly abnormal protein 6 homolog isoform X2 [Eriocheir sinensis]
MESVNSGSSSSGDVLLEREVAVQVVEAGAAVSSATRRYLKLLVELRLKPSAPSKELLVRLTDEQDPFMLLSSVVREEDYHTLRQRQGLLVDFSAFPHKFVELVNSCIQEASKDSPRFLLVLRYSGDSGGGAASLEVTEVNIFKHLCHLALALTPASTQLKLTYLADCCKALKAKVTTKEREASETEHQLRQEVRQTHELLSKSSREVEQLRSELSLQVAASSEKQAQLINQEKDKILRVQSDADRKADRERRELEARLTQRIEHLQVKVSSLTSHNSDLSEKKHRAESNVRELRARLQSAEGDLERCRQELSHVKKQNARLEQDNHSKTNSIRELESRVSHVEGELRSRETSLGHTQQMMEALQQQKINLEATLEERQQKLLKRENSIQLIYTELQKSLEIIKKLQKRVKEEHMTSKVRGTALMEQDKVLAEKTSQLSQLSEQLQSSTSKLSQLTLERDQLQKQLQESNEKIQEQEKILHTNENVISWLNKQLNEAEVTGGITKRAPLTEAYFTSQRPATGNVKSLGSYFPSGSQPGLLLHSTPLSTTALSQPPGTGGSAGMMHSTLSSIRHLGNIPPIPEEISPRASQDSPVGAVKATNDKEKSDGLDPMYLEPTKPAAIGVHGLLRANAFKASAQDSDPKKARDNNPAGIAVVSGSRRGGSAGEARGRGRGRGGRGPSTQPSSYFPRT